MNDDQLVQAILDKKIGWCRVINRSADGSTKTCASCSCAGYIVNSKLYVDNAWNYGTGLHTDGTIIDANSNGCLTGGESGWRASAATRINKCLSTGGCDCFTNLVD